MSQKDNTIPPKQPSPYNPPPQPHPHVPVPMLSSSTPPQCSRPDLPNSLAVWHALALSNATRVTFPFLGIDVVNPLHRGLELYRLILLLIQSRGGCWVLFVFRSGTGGLFGCIGNRLWISFVLTDWWVLMGQGRRGRDGGDGTYIVYLVQ